MKRITAPPSFITRGSALIITMAYIAVLSLLLAGLMQWAGTENVQIVRRTERIQSLYGAEAAVRRSMAQIKNLMVGQYPLSGYMANYVAPSTADLANLNPPSSVAGLSQSSFTGISNYYPSSTSTNVFVRTLIPTTSTDPFAGLTSSRATVICQATAIQNGRFNIPQTVRQELFIDYIPIFQYAVYYNGDMELFNGPNMIIDGKVHVNGNFYFNNHGSIDIRDNLTLSGDLLRGLKQWNSRTGTWTSSGPWDNTPNGPFRVKNPRSGSMIDGQERSGGQRYYDSNAGDWATGALTKWGGGVKTSDQGINTINPPLPPEVLATATDPDNPYHVMIEKPSIVTTDNVVWSPSTTSESSSSKKAKMAYSASLVIHRSGTNVFFKVPVKDAGNNVLGFRTINLYNKNNIIPPARTTVHDHREYVMDGQKISMSELNLESLYNAVNPDGTFKADSTGNPIVNDAAGNPIGSAMPVKFNGMIYFYDDGYNGSGTSPATSDGFAPASYRPGLRINDKSSGGASATKNFTLPTSSRGISIVSETPAYVLGNFNADGDGATAPEGGTGGRGTLSNPNREASLDPTGTISSSNPATGVKPAMIVADAVSFMSSRWAQNVLSGSGSWDNTSSFSPGSTLFNLRKTGGNVVTEVNAAVIAGSSHSSKSARFTNANGAAGGSTGGIHNYPRFMEDMGGANFKISGSMVSLFFSKQSKSYFVDAGGGANNVYNPPTRYYAFNTELLNPNKLPPGTPVVRRFAPGVWRDF